MREDRIGKKIKLAVLAPLPRDFYSRDPRLVSRDLLGKILLRRRGRKLLSWPDRGGGSHISAWTIPQPILPADGRCATPCYSALPAILMFTSSMAIIFVSTYPAFPMGKREGFCFVRLSP